MIGVLASNHFLFFVSSQLCNQNSVTHHTIELVLLSNDYTFHLRTFRSQEIIIFWVNSKCYFSFKAESYHSCFNILLMHIVLILSYFAYAQLLDVSIGNFLMFFLHTIYMLTVCISSVRALAPHSLIKYFAVYLTGNNTSELATLCLL